MTKKQKKVLIRIIAAAVCMIILSVLPVKGYIRFALYMIPYLIVGYDILRKAFKGIINRQVFDENFLMAVATIGAIALGEYVEGVAVMLFYQIGELFQSYAVGKSRKNISELMDIRPDYANIQTEEGGLEQVDPDEVEVGTVIVVQPGEKVPIDGVIIEGETMLDSVALTGESVPREARTGDEVVSGCVSMTGVLKIRTTKEFGESTVSKILDLVENASSRKSRSENFISRFARYYTPAVCYGALALAVLPPVVRMACFSLAPAWSDWIYRALTFLVISCPCALVISIPLSFFAGIGGASREGILVKGSNYLEALSQVNCVVFDKTGTLTEGVFEVVKLHPRGIEEEDLLELAALAECYSTHPVAVSIRNMYGKRIDQTRVRDVQEISGRGVEATVDGRKVTVTNQKELQNREILFETPDGIGTVAYVTVDGKYVGSLLVADRIKKSSPDLILGLAKAGVSRMVMLSGDRSEVAQSIGTGLGIKEYYGDLMPADKVAHVERILQENAGKGKVAFAGDGINDAPVLSRADVGIAMGVMGADAAIEAADVVLMDDEPVKIAKAIRIARKCMRIVYENIYFAIGVKFICLLLGAIGIANMWVAIFADVGVMVLAVLNAIRALAVKNL